MAGCRSCLGIKGFPRRFFFTGNTPIYHRFKFFTYTRIHSEGDDVISDENCLRRILTPWTVDRVSQMNQLELLSSSPPICRARFTHIPLCLSLCYFPLTITSVALIRNPFLTPAVASFLRLSATGCFGFPLSTFCRWLPVLWHLLPFVTGVGKFETKELKGGL